MDPTQEETYKFLDKFIGEMAGLFPDQFFHIGGDEVNGKEWDANPKIQAFKQAHGLKDNNDLQAYFNQRVQKIVAKHGKTMLGWDEILRPDLPKDIAIQSWRGPDSLAQAAKQGYRGFFRPAFILTDVVGGAALCDRAAEWRRRQPDSGGTEAHPGRRGLHVVGVCFAGEILTLASGLAPRHR
jgi:N-acetyl-beta-hexosaminidase